MSRSLKDLEPAVAQVVGEWLRICGSKGVAVLVYCTLRTEAEQLKLYWKGRDLLEGADPQEKANWTENGGRIVTNAPPGSSFHNYGLAIDAAPYEYLLRTGNKIQKKLDWGPFPTKVAEAAFREDGDLAHLDRGWRVMVEAADKVGLEWSGRWTSFVEYVHFQHTGGATIAELRGDIWRRKMP